MRGNGSVFQTMVLAKLGSLLFFPPIDICHVMNMDDSMMEKFTRSGSSQTYILLPAMTFGGQKPQVAYLRRRVNTSGIARYGSRG